MFLPFFLFILFLFFLLFFLIVLLFCSCFSLIGPCPHSPHLRPCVTFLFFLGFSYISYFSPYFSLILFLFSYFSPIFLVFLLLLDLPALPAPAALRYFPIFPKFFPTFPMFLLFSFYSIPIFLLFHSSFSPIFSLFFSYFVPIFLLLDLPALPRACGPALFSYFFLGPTLGFFYISYVSLKKTQFYFQFFFLFCSYFSPILLLLDLPALPAPAALRYSPIFSYVSFTFPMFLRFSSYFIPIFLLFYSYFSLIFSYFTPISLLLDRKFLRAPTGATACPLRGEDVVSFLESAGWQQVQILRRPFRRGEWKIYATPPTADLAQFIQGDADLIVTATRCTGNRRPEKELAGDRKIPMATRMVLVLVAAWPSGLSGRIPWGLRGGRCCVSRRGDADWRWPALPAPAALCYFPIFPRFFLLSYFSPILFLFFLLFLSYFL